MKNIVIFTTIHYPDKKQFFQLLDVIDKHQIGYVEIGIPVKDPYVDGKIIKESHAKVLKKGLKFEEIVETLKAIKALYHFKVILMTYKTGIENFKLAVLDRSLYDGIICVDATLSSQEFMNPIYIYSERMGDEELAVNVRRNSLFNYVISGQGKTGTFDKVPTEYIQTLQRIKKVSSQANNFVGFGIKNKEDRKSVIENGADGIVIGTEFLKKFNEGGIEVVDAFLEQFDE